MKLALVNHLHLEPRVNAHRNADCRCRFCEAPVLTQPGNGVPEKWVHRNTRHCDEWWETETKWHRDWKNLFPNHWLEVLCCTDDGTTYIEEDIWHIADVMSPDKAAMKMQRGAITPKEIKTRTAFYETCTATFLWLVDACRLTSEREPLARMLDTRTESSGIWNTQLVRESNFCGLLKKWDGLDVPVAFDLGDDNIWVQYGYTTEWPGLRPGRMVMGYKTSRKGVTDIIRHHNRRGAEHVIASQAIAFRPPTEQNTTLPGAITRAGTMKQEPPQ